MQQIILLRQNIYIQRFLAAFLLAVFALSISPKKVLHDVFAKHKESHHKLTNNSFQFAEAGYNCDTASQVAESAFFGPAPLFSSPLEFVFSFFSEKGTSFHSAYKVYSSLRGPPSGINA